MCLVLPEPFQVLFSGPWDWGDGYIFLCVFCAFFVSDGRLNGKVHCVVSLLNFVFVLHLSYVSVDLILLGMMLIVRCSV